MDTLTQPSVWKTLAAFNITALAIVVGVALNLRLFSIPIILDAQDISAAIMLRQYHHLIDLGAKYMQTSSRILAGTLVGLAAILYNNPDSHEASRWLWFAIAAFTLVQTAWWEIVFVFPTNNYLLDLERRLKKSRDPTVDREAIPDILRSLETWQKGHIGRILIPLLAVGLTLYGTIKA